MEEPGRKAVYVLVGAVYSPQESKSAVQKAKPRTTDASRRSVFAHGSPKIMPGNRYLHHRLLDGLVVIGCAFWVREQNRSINGSQSTVGADRETGNCGGAPVVIIDPLTIWSDGVPAIAISICRMF